MKVVFRYVKYGMTRFVSSRDTIRAIERNFRRAEVPMIFTKGFHPHPVMSFLDSSPVGVINRAIYFSIELEYWDEKLFKTLRSKAVKGLIPEDYWVSDVDINSVVDSYRYSLFLEKGFTDLSKLSENSIIKKGKKGKEYRIGELMDGWDVIDLKRYHVVKYTLKREKMFSPWELVKLVKKGEGIFLPVLEEALSGGVPLRKVLEG